MKSQKRKKVSISLIACLIISLGLLGWWAAANIALLSTIILPTHAAIKLFVFSTSSKPLSYKPFSYKPIHYVFFDGNDSYGLIPANQKLNVSQFSIAFWAKSDGPSHGNFDRSIEMLQWIKNSSGVIIPHGWAFDAGDQSRIGTDKLRFTVGNTHGNLFSANAVTIPRNSWTHVVGTFDGVALKVYRNGVLTNSAHFIGPYSYPVTPIPIRLAAGWLPHHYWTGDLSDIRIYQRALSPSEINSILHGNNIPNGLIGHWKLNEGSGSSIMDSSGNGNNGAVHNPTWR